jgi:ABC-type nitrate/sulfonate/bicarbonate transport system permease component
MTASAPSYETITRGKAPSWQQKNARMLYGAFGVVGFMLFWEFGSRAGIINEFFFSRPTGIIQAGINEVQLERFWVDVRFSFTEFILGYLLAIVLAIPIGLASGWYRRLQYVLDPWFNFLNSLPRFALLPVIVIWVGLGIQSKIAVVFLGAFFAIVIPTVQGVRTVDRRFVDVATSFGSSRAKMFREVVLPATVPFIVTGLRLGVARALIGVVTAELYAANDGLGVMIKKASEQFQTDRLLFGVLIFTFAGIIGVELIRRFETYFQRWRPVKGVAQ